MSIEAIITMLRGWDGRAAPVSGGPRASGEVCRLVLLVLAERASPQVRDGARTWEAWPSAATIANETGLAIGTVRLALTQLRSEGWIDAVNGARGGRGRSTRYVLLLDPDDDAKRATSIARFEQDTNARRASRDSSETRDETRDARRDEPEEGTSTDNPLQVNGVAREAPPLIELEHARSILRSQRTLRRGSVVDGEAS